MRQTPRSAPTPLRRPLAPDAPTLRRNPHNRLRHAAPKVRQAPPIYKYMGAGLSDPPAPLSPTVITLCRADGLLLNAKDEPMDGKVTARVQRL